MTPTPYNTADRGAELRRCDCGREQSQCVRDGAEECPLWHQDNELDPDDDEFDDMSCGRRSDGGCDLAATEFCDWSCPYSDEHFKAKAAKPLPLFDRADALQRQIDGGKG